MNDYFNVSENLKVLPTNRAAYSDRTAWMMSEMSTLAYLQFEGEYQFKVVLDAIAKLAKIARQKESEKGIAKQITELENNLKNYIAQQLDGDAVEPLGLQKLKNALADASFNLICTFNTNDTQAFLAGREKDKIAVLAFRGTEANSWIDVKTDLNARFYKGEAGVKIHTGFRDAYNQVRDQVKSAVNNLPEGYSLYITGHSLGGALAVVASEDLERDSLAACYTYGSPRVGNEEFGEGIRSPIYRIVNAADGVPRVPPSWPTHCIVFLVSFINRELADCLERNFCGYMHQGDMRYLTACERDVSKLKVIPNLGMPFRVFRMAKRMIAKGPSIAGKDHRISEYQCKLKFYAKKRSNTRANLPNLKEGT